MRYAITGKLASSSKFLLQIAPLVLLTGFSVPTPARAVETISWNAPTGTKGWCTIAGGINSQCFGDPEAACKLQHQIYGGPGQFYGAFNTLKWHLKQCKWEHKVGYSLPAQVMFYCATGFTPVMGPRGGYCTQEPFEHRNCKASNGGNLNPTTRHPINILSGSKVFSETDFVTADNSIALTRKFVSRPFGGLGTGSAIATEFSLGNWTSFFDISLQLANDWDTGGLVTLINPDGTSKRLKRQTSGAYTNYATFGYSRPDTNGTIQFVGTWPGSYASVVAQSTQWTVIDSDNNTWTLQTQLDPDTNAYRIARPVSLQRPDGSVLTFTYNSASSMTIADQTGKTITVNWNTRTVNGATLKADTVDSIGLPGGYSIKYHYEKQDGSSGSSGYVRLRKVDYRNSLSVIEDSKSYSYGDSRFPTSVTAVLDHLGETRWKVTYDDQGRAVRSEGPNGEFADEISYGVVAGNTFSRTQTDALGRQTVFNFNRSTNEWATRLVSVQGLVTANCAASSAANTYDSNWFLATAADEEGRVTKYTRNTLGQPTQVIEGFGTPLARTTNMIWHATYSLPTEIAEPGITTNYSYDSQGRVTTLTQTDTTTHSTPYATNGQSRSWVYAYGVSGGAAGKLVSIDGPLTGAGDTQYFTYNTDGYLASVTDEVGKTTSVTSWDWRGAPLSATDANNVTTSFSYDIHGRVLTTAVNPGPSQSLYSFEYDVVGNLVKTTLPTGGFLEYGYDAASRLISIRNDKNETVTLTPNAVGDPTLSVTKTSGGTITAQQSMVYDELGRLIQTLGSASTTPTQFGYDKVDNLKTVTDGRGKVTNTAFDALDRVVTATNPDSQSINYAYNAQDVVVSHKDGRNLETTFVTNGFGEVIREVSPDRGTRTYWYDTAGRMTRVNDADGVETNLAYDNAGRLTGKTFTGAAQEAMTFTYDSVASGNSGNGRLTAVTEQSGASAFTYDAQGRVTTDAKTIQGVNYSVGYAYNANGQITQTTLPSGRVITFARDTAGLITGITTAPTSGGAASTILSSMTYAPFSGLTNATYGNGLTWTRTFNTNGWLTRIELKDGATPKFDLSYDYYDDGRLGEIVDNAATGRTVYMSLSNSGRLTYANGPWGQESYAYDAAGNRTGSYLTVGGITTSNNEITAGTSNRLVQVQDNSAAIKRQLTYRSGGDLYSDAISGGTTYTYQYSARKRLVGVQNNGTDAAWYGYDFREQRVWRRLFSGGSSSEIHYIFDQDGHLLAEHNGYSGAVLREYIWAGDTAVAVIDKTSGTAVTYYIHNGHLNEPQIMTNASKAKVWDAYVTPFGSAKVFTTATANVDIRLPGQWYQAEAAGSGLNQNHHRDYDPSLGRYIQVDPIGLGGGQNPYAYVDGMVYDYTDPTGLDTYIFVTDNTTEHTPGGEHVALYIKTKGSGLPGLLYDPNGSFPLTDQWGEDARGTSAKMTESMLHPNLRDEYIHHETRGPRVVHEIIVKTTLAEEARIRENIGEGNDSRTLNCASDVSYVIRGVGPFKNKGSMFPGTVLKIARDAMKLRGGGAWDWRKK